MTNIITNLWLLLFSVLAIATYATEDPKFNPIINTIKTDTIGHDTVLANMYFEKASGLTDSAQYDTSILYYNKAATLYEKHKLWYKLIKSYHEIGQAYINLFEPDTALLYCEKAISITKEYFDENHLIWADNYLYLGGSWYSKRDFNRAMEYHYKTLEIRTKVLGKDHMYVAQSYNNIGRCYFEKGNDKKALLYYNKALGIQTKIAEEDHEDFAYTYMNLGMYFMKKEDYNKALEYYKKGLVIKKKEKGEYHAHVAFLNLDIGLCYQKKQDYDQSLDYYQNALNILDKISGKNNIHKTFLYGLVGRCYIKTEKYGEAIPYLIKTLNSKDSLIEASVYYDLGTCYMEKKDYDKAIKCYNRNLNIRINTFGENHFDLILCYINIALCYEQKGNYDEALKYHKKTLDIQSNASSYDYFYLVASYRNIGRCYMAKMNFDKALEFYTKAINIQTSSLENDRPNITLPYFNIGICYMFKADYDRAIKYLEKAIDIKRGNSIFDISNEDSATSTLQIHNAIAFCYQEKGDYDRALNYLDEIIKIHTNIENYDHADRTSLHNNIGLCLLKKGNYDKALKHLEKALEIQSEMSGYSPNNLLENIEMIRSYNNMGFYYIAMGNYNQALEYLNKTLKFHKNLPHYNIAIANVDSNIGLCHLGLSNYDIALKYFNKSLDMLVIILGDDHPRIAFSYNMIGQCYAGKGNHEISFKYYKKVLEVYNKTPDHSYHDTTLLYNNFGIYYINQGDYDLAQEYFEKAFDVLAKTFDDNYWALAISYNNIGLCYKLNGYYSKAMEYCMRALDILTKISDCNNLNIASAYGNIGALYTDQGNYDQGLYHLNKALDIKTKILGFDNSEVAMLIDGIGELYMEKGDCVRALDYYHKALNISVKFLDHQHPFFSGTYYKIGQCHMMRGNYSQCIKYYNKAQNNQTKKQKNPIWRYMGNFANLITDSFFYEDIDRELKYLSAILNNEIKILGQYNPLIALYHNSIGFCYMEKGDYSRALKHYNKAIEIETKIFGEYDVDASYYLDIGICLVMKGDYNKGLSYYQQALMSVCKDFKDPTIASNPTLRNISSKFTLLDILAKKAYTLSKFYSQSQNTDDLRLSFNTYQLAISLIDSLRWDITSVGSKQDLMDNYVDIYEETINIAHRLYEQTCENVFLHQAFRIAEKSKAFRLLQALKESEAKQFGNIPNILLEIEKKNRLDLAVQEKLLYYEQIKWRHLQDNGEIVQYQNKVFALKRQNDSLITHFETNYPDYHKLKYDLSISNIRQVQKQLLDSPSKALLEYLVGDSSIYIFCITQNDIKLHQIKKDSFFDQALIEYIENTVFNTPEKQKRGFETYVNAAYYLYQLLIEKPMQSLGTNVSELIIIPDGELGLISFSALVIQLPKVYKPDRLRYLIEDYILSYAYSATLLLEQAKEKEKKKVKYNLTAFAPVIFEKKDTSYTEKKKLAEFYFTPGCLNNLSKLFYSEKEAFDITESLKSSKAYLYENATKTNFELVAPVSRILHFATHACVEDKDPMYSKLYFSDDELETYELFNMPLNADLAVLSACETGLGEIQRGEGIMSLTRGFTYAGCPAIVTSLWSVNDRTTSEIMIHFYEMLKKGQSKDEALRNAQLAYINDPHKYPKEVHPYYWAAFVLMGNTEAIELSGNQFVTYVIWVGVGILALFLSLYRKKLFTSRITKL